MKIKLDENLPLLLRDRLAALGHDVDTVQSEGLVGAPDHAILTAVQTEGRLLLTQDLDFSDERTLTWSAGFGVVLLRLHQPSAINLIHRVLALFATEDATQFDGALVVVSDSKLRVSRRPARPHN